MDASVEIELNEIRRSAAEECQQLKGKSILSIKDLSCQQIQCILDVSAIFKKQANREGLRNLETLRGRIITTLFYEPSTRTRCSFEAAMKRLGGGVIGINEVASSSVAKGETFEDTIRTVSPYSDAIVLRHPTAGASKLANAYSKVPIFNAGDGCGEHPTQALLDLFTIAEHFPHILQKGPQTVVVSLVGDLLHGRTVHSLAMLLAKYNVQLNFVAPDELQIPSEIEMELSEIFAENGWEPKNRSKKCTCLDEVIKTSDIIYMTRLQKERFSTPNTEKLGQSYALTTSLMHKASATTKIMHPLPRVDEISHDVDADARAIYFEQASNGLYVRMALLWLVLCSD